MTALAELEEHLSTVHDQLADAVVSIGRDHRGSGIVVDRGAILTSAHNLRDRTTSITFADGETVQAAVTAADVDGDLAVLAADTGERTPVPWAEGEDGPRVGTIVFALAGAPSGSPRVTFGNVTATERAFRGPRGRAILGSVEHSAPLPRGSSGGPIVDADGRLLGVNTHRLGRSFYLARPADSELRRTVDQLLEGEVPQRRRLGVALIPDDAAAQVRRAAGLEPSGGALVRAVVESGPADRAGLREGDLIVMVGDRPIETVDDLQAAVDTIATDTATITFRRGDNEQTVEVDFSTDAPDGSDGAEGSED